MEIIIVEGGDFMKKVYKVLLVVGICLVLAGCGCMKKTAKGAVQDYLNQYKNLSSNVISSMDNVVNDENLTDSQKEKYRDILKRQYQDLKYEITSEKYDGDNATVEVKITVYDLYKVQKDANNYLTNSGDEFKENGVYSNDLFMNYKLDKMKKVTDTVEYNITFNVTKDDKGNYKVNDLSNSDLEKIHGVYNYDNDYRLFVSFLLGKWQIITIVMCNNYSIFNFFN